MKTMILCFLTLASVLVAENPNGRWQATRAEMAGNAFPDAVTKTLLLVVADGKYDLQNDHGTISFLEDKRMVITGTDGPNKGKTFKAIYKIDGDRLTICYDLSGEGFPTSFKTMPESKLFLVNYSRVN